MGWERKTEMGGDVLVCSGWELKGVVESRCSMAGLNEMGGWQRLMWCV